MRHRVIKWSLETDFLILDTINILTIRNNAKTRILLKDENFFALRDAILLNIVRTAESDKIVKNVMSNFSLVSICNSSLFRKHKGLTNLIRILVNTEDQILQEDIYKLLSTYLAAEESLEYVKLLFNNKSFEEHFFRRFSKPYFMSYLETEEGVRARLEINRKCLDEMSDIFKTVEDDKSKVKLY